MKSQHLILIMVEVPGPAPTAIMIRTTIPGLWVPITSTTAAPFVQAEVQAAQTQVLPGVEAIKLKAFGQPKKTGHPLPFVSRKPLVVKQPA